MKRFSVNLAIWTSVVLICFLAGVGVTLQAAPENTTMMITLTPPPKLMPKPLVMLTIYDPWQMVIGSDEPTFVLYSNGQLIYQRIGAADGMEFASVVLMSDELETLLNALHIDATVYALGVNDDYFTKTDQPTNVIKLWDEKLGEKTFSIYGNLFSDPEAREQAADKGLIDLFDALVGYSHPGAEPWMPEQFEVVLWPYDYSDPIEWPKDWPGLDDPTTVKRDSVYSLYLEMSAYEQFLALVEDGYALRVDGATWAFSVRFPFPHERNAG